MSAIAVWTCPENTVPAHEHIADTQGKSYQKKGNVHAAREDFIVDHSGEERTALWNLQKTLPLIHGKPGQVTQITLIAADFSHLLLT